MADIAPTVNILREISKHIQERREFNSGWINLHLRDGHPAAARRREEVVAECDRWLMGLTEAIDALEVARG